MGLNTLKSSIVQQPGEASVSHFPVQNGLETLDWDTRRIVSLNLLQASTMEDTFRVRVDKIFGSLTSSSSSSATPSSSLSSPWSLTDDEIQRREWIREKGSPEPEPNSYPSFLANRRENSLKNSKDDYRFELEKDIEDLDDNDIEDDECKVGFGCGSSNRSAKPDDYGDEEWEIKSSIGLDSTLDYEVLFPFSLSPLNYVISLNFNLC